MSRSHNSPDWPTRRVLVAAAGLVLMIGPSAAAIANQVPSGTLGTWEFSAKVTPDDADEPGISDPETGNINPSHSFVHFGSSVAVDGSTMAVGTSVDTCDLATWAYVFERTTTGSWDQLAKLKPNDGNFAGTHVRDTCKAFGFSVAVDEEENVIAVGNPRMDTTDDGREVGAVYVFERGTDSAWTQTTRLEHPGGISAAGSNFGRAVAVDGGVIVVGAPFDSREAHNAGAGFVYTYENGEWSRVAEFTGEGYRSFLGLSVATSDESAFLSSPGRNHIAIVDKVAGVWSTVRELTPPEPLGAAREGAPNFFGRSLDAEGDDLIVGASSWPALADIPLMGWRTGSQGIAFVFERVGGDWELEAQLLPPDSHPEMIFGWSVGIGEGVAVVGARDAVDIPTQGGMGTAYVFEETKDKWFFSSRLRAPDTSPGDNFGENVDVGGGSVVAGAPFDDNRRDGTPYPADDDADVPPCIDRDIVWGCDEGENAGSVYAFEALDLSEPSQTLEI